ncbi:hypothetical protein F5Y08DRAFT_28877 [Xylaria arbuscula]|nr:hypothetical protein F5Y08DRAFT_28877 [Xylaria arbuscula]
MQFTTFIAAVATFAIGTTNGAVMRRDGARLAQFRVFGAEGCSNLNYGFYTVDYTDIGLCKALTTDPSPVESLNLELTTTDAAGCSLFIYSDKNCTAGESATTVNVCNNVADASEAWGSYKIVC